MALLDRFKKGKKAGSVASPEAAAPKATVTASKPVEPETSLRVKAKGERRLIGVLVRPHITEKSASGGSQGWYTFRVAQSTNKLAVKAAIEERYAVRVERVRIVNQRSKRMRLGRREGEVPGFKKAMVKLAAGQSLELA